MYFAVGSYGFDASRGGLCYRLKAESVDRDIIMQVINQAGMYVSMYVCMYVLIVHDMYDCVQ